MPDDKPAPSRIVDRSAPGVADERAGVVARLLGSPPSIAPRYFYDELGCALYGAICQLPEYYPTRTEVALFREHRSDIAAERHLVHVTAVVDGSQRHAVRRAPVADLRVVAA